MVGRLPAYGSPAPDHPRTPAPQSELPLGQRRRDLVGEELTTQDFGGVPRVAFVSRVTIPFPRRRQSKDYGRRR